MVLFNTSWYEVSHSQFSQEPNPVLYIRIFLPNVLFTEELNKYITPHEKHTPFTSFYPGSLSSVLVYLISIFLSVKLKVVSMLSWRPESYEPPSHFISYPA